MKNGVSDKWGVRRNIYGRLLWIFLHKWNELLSSLDFYANKFVACNPTKTIKANLVKYTQDTLN